MTRSPVKSSNLKSVGYDPASRTLEVEFHSGAVHQYHDVAPEHEAKLRTHPSPGAYFHQHIRDKHKHSKPD